jgi:hypothetical protein
MADVRGPFNTFMDQHAPLGQLVDAIDDEIWERSALEPVIKERARIASAEELGCAY